MNAIDRIILRRAAVLRERERRNLDGGFSESSGASYLQRRANRLFEAVSSEQSLRLSTVFACVSLISEAVAALPLRPYHVRKDGKVLCKDDPTYELLAYAPNERTTRFTLLETLVKSMLLNGNGFALIERANNGTARALYYQDANDIVAFIVDTPTGRKIDHYYNFRTGRVIEPNDMIHLLNFTLDGLEGLSTLRYAAYTLGLAQSAELHASNFYDGSGALSGVLTISGGRLNEQRRTELRKQWESQMATGGGLAILDMDASYTPVTVKPQDAQLLETRKFSVPEICRFFKVSPVMVNDLTHSSYSTVEATNLAFLTNTLTPYIEKIELEFRKKIYPPMKRREMVVEFDTRNLTRADTSAQAGLYQTLFNLGAVTPNEIRDAFNLEPREDGNDLFAQVNMQKLEAFDNGGEEKNQGDTLIL